MKEKVFKYSVLKYRPSYWLDEHINIGLFFWFQEEDKISFLYPNQLKRIHNLFPEANLGHIRYRLTRFSNYAERLTKQGLPPFLELDDFLNSEFLVSDANAFYFSPAKSGVYQHSSKITSYYYDSYFSIYDISKKEKNKDEAWISNLFSTCIKKQSREKFHLFDRKVNLKNNIAHASFDYSWQNGTLNLVKTLGFDLQHPDSILDKSNLWFGKLTCLQSEIDGKYKIDFLVSEPTSRDQELKNSYLNALEVLKKLEVKKEIIPVSDIPEYVDHALQSIKADN